MAISNEEKLRYLISSIALESVALQVYNVIYNNAVSQAEAQAKLSDIDTSDKALLQMKEYLTVACADKAAGDELYNYLLLLLKGLQAIAADDSGALAEVQTELSLTELSQKTQDILTVAVGSEDVGKAVASDMKTSSESIQNIEGAAAGISGWSGTFKHPDAVVSNGGLTLATPFSTNIVRWGYSNVGIPTTGKKYLEIFVDNRGGLTYMHLGGLFRSTPFDGGEDYAGPNGNFDLVFVADGSSLGENLRIRQATLNDELGGSTLTVNRPSYGTGNTVALIFDFDNGKYWTGVNGVLSTQTGEASPGDVNDLATGGDISALVALHSEFWFAMSGTSSAQVTIQETPSFPIAGFDYAY